MEIPRPTTNLWSVTKYSAADIEQRKVVKAVADRYPKPAATATPSLITALTAVVPEKVERGQDHIIKSSLLASVRLLTVNRQRYLIR